MWQMGGLGPMGGQANHFRAYAPEKIPYAIDRYTNEVQRLWDLLDWKLEGQDWIANNEYSIADMACWGWITLHEIQGQDLAQTPNLQRCGLTVEPNAASPMRSAARSRRRRARYLTRQRRCSTGRRASASARCGGR